ncbi:ornithine carbamoyltransferase [Alkalicoccus urumqiensis]|uniref:Ornithine carbamoyltransferase n=1 Tax=Alkalicoccus urumqiensis TaxID=1548213 RepID=A0A2P6MKW2_ALKUR|nr:ornithine carbamoyltransferase [Alkalicoccus urumqiensis]PRO66927.1 ornithine carbamoyltransferase [Alkalicoccus urumqiensis]
MTQHLLKITDVTKDELMDLLDDAKIMKQQVKEGVPHPHLAGKTLGMIFEKASTRTRVSFEVGMTQLGGHAIFLSSKDMQLGRGESVHDTAKVLSRYVDGVMIRTFGHDMVESFAAHSDVPVINGLTDEHHPTQVLADLMTIQEHKGTLEGLTMAFIGDGNNNMTHSLIQGAVLSGMNMHVASPEGYEPDAGVWKEAEASGTVFFSHDPSEAVKEADVVVTDVWTSMGSESETEGRLKAFEGYQVNEALMSSAAADALFLHCLPAHRGEEVSAGVIDGPQSAVFDEAENRLHAQKALLKKLL